jgi:hypothetical protein
MEKQIVVVAGGFPWAAVISGLVGLLALIVGALLTLLQIQYRKRELRFLMYERRMEALNALRSLRTGIITKVDNRVTEQSGEGITLELIDKSKADQLALFNTRLLFDKDIQDLIEIVNKEYSGYLWAERRFKRDKMSSVDELFTLPIEQKKHIKKFSKNAEELQIMLEKDITPSTKLPFPFRWL